MIRGCTCDCNQGRRPCTCGERMPDVPMHIVDRAYQAQPSPLVERWLDEHPRLGTAVVLGGVLALFLLGAWLDGAV